MKPHPRTPKRAAIAATLVLATAAASRAAIVITLQQVGGNVIETGSGSANLSALTFITNGVSEGMIFPSAQTAVVGTTSILGIAEYSGATGPFNFGAGAGKFANSGTGQTFGISGGDVLFLPQGYVSGTSLSGSSTFNAQTFVSLGITPGTYTWTWGTGATADSLTITTNAAAVPEPGSALAGMLALGVCACGLLRRVRKSGAACYEARDSA